MQPEELRAPDDDTQGLLWLVGRNRGDPRRPRRAARYTSIRARHYRKSSTTTRSTRCCGATRDLLWAPKPDARPYLLVEPVVADGDQEERVHGDPAEHIDLSNQQAPVLYVRYEDPRKTLKERKLALGPTFTPVYRQYLREYKPQDRPLRLHGAESGVRAGGRRPSGGHRRWGFVRAVALDVRGTRLSQRHAVGPVAPEARPVAHQLARDAAENPAVGTSGAVADPFDPTEPASAQRGPSAPDSPWLSLWASTPRVPHSPLLPNGSNWRMIAS